MSLVFCAAAAAYSSICMFTNLLLCKFFFFFFFFFSVDSFSYTESNTEPGKFWNRPAPAQFHFLSVCPLRLESEKSRKYRCAWYIICLVFSLTRRFYFSSSLDSCSYHIAYTKSVSFANFITREFNLPCTQFQFLSVSCLFVFANDPFSISLLIRLNRPL